MTNKFTRRALSVTGVAALTLIAAFAPQAAFASTPDGPPAFDATEAHTLIANDPDLQFVSMTEAVEQFGFDPEVESVEATDDAGGGMVTPLNDWWGCGWDGVADWPHKSRNEASVHGYWVYNGGNCPSTADVTVNLQALGCTNFGCTWITQATDSVSAVAPGSGTGRWATPHKTCATSEEVAWRGEVYVGLTNFWHPYGAQYGAIKDLFCSPI